MTARDLQAHRAARAERARLREERRRLILLAAEGWGLALVAILRLVSVWH